MPTRDLLLILGDQLAADHPALADLDPAQDRVLFIEAPGEATHVWSDKARIAIFLAAMRHYAAALRERGQPVTYLALDDHAAPALIDRLADTLRALRPKRLRLLEPGAWRLEQAIQALCAEAHLPLDLIPDPHFYCARADFSRWASGYKGSLRMEYFYRQMRREHRVLLTPQGEPEGGAWNYDAENRKGYPKAGPGWIPAPAAFPPDPLTAEVLALVEARFPNHPGSLAHFGWPVTREQALLALRRFIDTRLATFGPYQDAMWTDTPFGWHSLLSTSLNLHLLDPREVVNAAEAAWREGRAPLESVEGFVRQILGWREFIRGVYWRDMPAMAAANHFGHHRPLPAFYWTGDTELACLRDVIGQTLTYGYAHHIQRLMVTGLFALLAELDPVAVSDWYLAVYVDAIEWVELPNVAGMALFADGGRFTSKPYIASGAYIARQSDHCARCRFRPEQRTGPDACPFTTLYWNFLDKHEAELRRNGRTALMAKNVARLSEGERAAIRAAAAAALAKWAPT